MAQFPITIPDQHLTRVVDALAESGHWTEELGVTKQAYAKTVVQQMIKDRVLFIERRRAEQAVQPPADLDM